MARASRDCQLTVQFVKETVLLGSVESVWRESSSGSSNYIWGVGRELLWLRHGDRSENQNTGKSAVGSRYEKTDENS
jgi:hypothetical protein